MAKKLMKLALLASAVSIGLATTAFAAAKTASPSIAGRPDQTASTATKAARKPLMIALPATFTPATTASQVTENHGAMASMAGFRIDQSPSRTTCASSSPCSR